MEALTDEHTLEKAIAIAAEAHTGAVGKAGEPFILHPLRVMLGVEGQSEQMAAVLHDVVEDTSWSVDRLREGGFSEEVLRTVDGLALEKTTFDFCRRAGADPIARVVKLADIEDNLDLSRIRNPTKADHERIERYR